MYHISFDCRILPDPSAKHLSESSPHFLAHGVSTEPSSSFSSFKTNHSEYSTTRTSTNKGININHKPSRNLHQNGVWLCRRNAPHGRVSFPHYSRTGLSCQEGVDILAMYSGPSIMSQFCVHHAGALQQKKTVGGMGSCCCAWDIIMVGA